MAHSHWRTDGKKHILKWHFCHDWHNLCRPNSQLMVLEAIRYFKTGFILLAVCYYRGGLPKSPSVIPSLPQIVCGWAQSHMGAGQRFYRSGLLFAKTEGAEVFNQRSWQYQQIRTVKRGTEYQPKNIKRKRTHGWIKRISSRGGIEVILRRMLKGRKSLTHWEPSDGLRICFEAVWTYLPQDKKLSWWICLFDLFISERCFQWLFFIHK